MTMFPLFVDLKDKKCVVIGGGRVAARKIKILLGFMAEIVVVSPVVSDKILELKNSGFLTHREKRYSEEDLEGAFLVIAATSDPAVNAGIAEDSGKKNIPVNVADNLSKCTFIFPSVVKKNGLVVGISTSGNYPLLAKLVREKTEKMLANLDDDVVEMLGKCRERASREIRDMDARKRILSRILQEAIFCEDVRDEEQRKLVIERIFEEVENEKTYQGRDKGKQAGDCSEQLGDQ